MGATTRLDHAPILFRPLCLCGGDRRADRIFGMLCCGFIRWVIKLSWMTIISHCRNGPLFGMVGAIGMGCTMHNGGEYRDRVIVVGTRLRRTSIIGVAAGAISCLHMMHMSVRDKIEENAGWWGEASTSR